MKHRVLFIGDKDFLKKYTDESIYEKYDVTVLKAGTSDDEVLEKCPEAEVLIVGAMLPVSEKLITGLKNLKLIHSNGVGYQAIDIKAADRANIPVCNCKGINAGAVAEHTLMTMLALLRELPKNDAMVRRGKWKEVRSKYMVTGSLKELGECTVGIIGLGDIGKSLALMLKPFGSKVVYYDRFRQTEENEEKYGVEYMPQDQLLAVSDIVTIHVPVFDSTRNMANKEFFAKMKEGGYFINTARGELCVTEDLLKALQSGHIAGAGLDTVRGEPILPDNVIFNYPPEVLDKIIFSPHTAGITGSTFKRGFKIIWDNTEKALNGEKLTNIVNLR